MNMRIWACSSAALFGWGCLPSGPHWFLCGPVRHLVSACDRPIYITSALPHVDAACSMFQCTSCCCSSDWDAELPYLAYGAAKSYAVVWHCCKL